MTAANEQGTIDPTANDLETIGKFLLASKELRILVASPIVSVKKKTEIFNVLFAAYVKQPTLDFLHLMIAKNREALLPDLIEQFNALRDDQLGIVTAEVKAAVELTSPQEKDLQSQLEQYTRKKVRVRFALDKQIKGGLVVKIGDTVLDASIRRQLERLKERFVAGDALSN
jgi:F-type H+-transporting ATPase subunit delta